MDDRQTKLRDMRICRFCLTEKDPLSNIYEKDKNIKNAIPLPLQIMACVTIEVFANDGMPQLICDDCRLQTRKSYAFKSMCKKSDDSLKLYLATGILKRQEKDEILKPKHSKRSTDSEIHTSPQKRAKVRNSTELTHASDEVQVSEELLNQGITIEPQDPLSLDPLFCDETAEEIAEHGEVPQPEKKKRIPKEVVTQCFSCEHCERSFPLQQLLEIHLRQHTRERKHACLDCGKKFFSKYDLSKHVQTHSGDKPFSCVVCGKSFARATLLHRHEKIHVSVPKYSCNLCEKEYLNAEDLHSHNETHARKRPFTCHECNKSFAFKQGLERHISMHSGDNPFKCDYCEESFPTAQKLARHVTHHAGTRPYPCKLCPRTFLLSHHLSRHLRNHYNRKSFNNEFGNFKCEFCSMSFRRKDSLINHTAIHSMVNLKCVICNKEFGDAKTVKDHVSTHLASLPYPCDRCDYSFETQEELEDHEVKHVDDEDEEEDEYILQDNSLEIVESHHEAETDPLEEEEVKPVRRSRRESKIKNYAEFLRDELGTDSEEEVEEPEEEKPEIQPTTNKVQVGTIQPVVRNDGIRMYKGKDKPDKNVILNFEQNLETTNIEPETQQSEKQPQISESRFEIDNLAEIEPGQVNQNEPTIKTPKSVTKITTLKNLGISKQTLDAMTEKSGYVEMKLGQKVIRVQKLMISKAEYQQMSKKGNMEMKGSTVVVPNLERNLNLKKLSQLSKSGRHDQISGIKVDMEPNVNVQILKSPIKTYVKKAGIKKEDLSQTNVVAEIVPQKDNYSDVNIDLTEASDNESSTIKEAELLEEYH